MIRFLVVIIAASIVATASNSFADQPTSKLLIALPSPLYDAVSKDLDDKFGVGTPEFTAKYFPTFPDHVVQLVDGEKDLVRFREHEGLKIAAFKRMSRNMPDFVPRMPIIVDLFRETKIAGVTIARQSIGRSAVPSGPGNFANHHFLYVLSDGGKAIDAGEVPFSFANSEDEELEGISLASLHLLATGHRIDRMIGIQLRKSEEYKLVRNQLLLNVTLHNPLNYEVELDLTLYQRGAQREQRPIRIEPKKPKSVDFLITDNIAPSAKASVRRLISRMPSVSRFTMIWDAEKRDKRRIKISSESWENSRRPFGSRSQPGDTYLPSLYYDNPRFRLPVQR